MTVKTPLVLLPGLLCDEALWTHQVQTLADIADMAVADLTLDDTIEGMVVLPSSVEIGSARLLIAATVFVVPRSIPSTLT